MSRTVIQGSGGSGSNSAFNNNFATGTFGTGKVMTYGAGSYSFVVPSGISSVRVRMWGAGGCGANSVSSYTGGGGGGFALKVIEGLSSGDSILITVGAAATSPNSAGSGGTSSFGSYVSATGGQNAVSTNSSRVGGVGTGGDINFAGGSSYAGGNGGGGGAASLFGNGGNGWAIYPFPNSGGADGGFSFGTTKQDNLRSAKNGFGYGGYDYTSLAQYAQPITNIDLIGTGQGGRVIYESGINGGGGSHGGSGGFPGGGGGSYALGSDGLLIVEY